jgi:hypothetical protein
MSAVNCPFCKRSLSPEELVGGWCGRCEKRLPPLDPGGTGGFGGRDKLPGTSPGSDEHRHGTDAWCDLCEKLEPNAARSYLKVVGQAITTTGSVRQRWVNVRCSCCPSCFGRARSLQTLRYTAVGVMFGLPALMCGGLGLIVDPLSRSGVPPILCVGLVLTAFALCVLSWVLSPFYIRSETRRRLRDLLKPALDERLRGLVGVPNWGWRHYVTASTTLPEGESCVDLRQV